MVINQQIINSAQADKVPWLASQIYEAFPSEVSGLKLYTLDCGCIHYQRVFKGGNLDPQTGIYRDSEGGPCEICMRFEQDWEDRVIDETVIYISQFEIEKI